AFKSRIAYAIANPDVDVDRFVTDLCHPVEIDDSNTIPPPWGDELVQDGAVFGDTEGCGVISSGASGYWLVDRTEGSLGGDPLGSPIQLGGTQKTAAAFLRSAGFEPWAEVE
ncbi:MAG: hypothetical protein AAFV36_09040, partial [Myxococcota bacterium]